MEKYQAKQNRACRLMRLSRSVFGYKAKLQDDSAIETTLKELAMKYKRYGFRKLFVKLRMQGHTWNHKRVYRVYCALKLNLKVKPKKRLPSRDKITLEQPKMINITWSLDYMSDALIGGKRFRTLNVIDDCNRESLGIKASSSLPSQQVTNFLDVIALNRGYPKKIRMDNGPENISKTMKEWAAVRKIELEYIQPGKPAQNGYIERFNRTYREEVLDMYLFRNIKEVQEITDQWIDEYNTERPHHSLGNLTPHQYSNNFLLLGCTKNGG
jgi:putative transposase